MSWGEMCHDCTRVRLYKCITLYSPQHMTKTERFKLNNDTDETLPILIGI